ncbi:hypothetical protein FKM82_004937 [Ascaphus truei]
MPHECLHLPKWVGASSGSESPVSTPESNNLSPAHAHCTTPRETINSYLQAQVYNMASHQTQDSLQGTRRTRCRMVGTQRESASEREKMRMRNLSKALHNLRRYLPPSVVPASRNLTKIETLRLTIRYISYLSQLLGQHEGTMSQRREPKPDMHDLYPMIYNERTCQERTCRHHQQIQDQSHSHPLHKPSHQYSEARISPIQPENLIMTAATPVYHRRHSTVTELSLSAPCCSRLTHLYQVADASSDLHSPSLKESDSNLRITDPLQSCISGVQSCISGVQSERPR